MEQTYTITYGELKIEALCSTAPADPSVGINDPIIDIEELHAPEINSIYVDDFLQDRLDKDPLFASTVEDLVRKADKEEAEAKEVERKLEARAA